MRALLIACVLFFTLLTFYSALWYKSETIEADITARVTDDLSAAGGDDVDINVDGRHVTLTGVVYDEAQEAKFLGTANDTYGALGPIDGLSYLSGGGFVKAVKSADGITLTGAVPSEDARASLVAAAGDATEGAVDDQLTISGPAGDWQDEAGFGLSQMAALSAGALAVSPGSYTLSGVADGDAAPVTEAVSGREGWQAFVSSPAVGEGLNARITELEGNVADRDQTIATLTGERDTLAGERDTLASENGALGAQRAALASKLEAMDADVASLTSENGALNGQRKALAGSLAAMTLNRDKAAGERDQKQQELDDLRASLDDNQSSVATLNADLSAARDGIAERDATIEGLNGEVAGLNGQIADLNGQIDGLNGDITGLNGKVADLEGRLSSQQTALNSDQSQVAELQDQLTARTAEVGDRDAMIETLKADVATETDGRKAAQAQIDALTGTVAERDTTIASLEGELANRGNSESENAARIAALTASVADQEGKAAALTGQVEELTAVVAERDATIAELKAAPAAATPAANVSQMAQQCSTRAGDVLADARINFGSGNARIQANSIETLERLTGIALACVDNGLSVEVGGHTDSQGSDANNQALSERRAQAIVSFMAERGVPTAGLKAVGYGETRPIGDNATSEGRAQNRRISFDWQAR